MAADTATPEKLEFKTELKQLLHIITHSLYSNQEIFLRELISNASDAINKLKHDSLDHEEKLEGDKDWKIKLIPDAEKSTLTISDNGVGMSRETIIDQLGTIAKSGTRAFLEALKQQKESDQPDLIGQFGVGFYSSYMVADKVTVRSRMAGDPPEDGVQWESDGQGEFTVEPFIKEKRGTDVILHLKDDAKDFLSNWKLNQLVKKYSNFLEHPVVMDVETTEDDKKVTKEEALNSREAIWLRRKQEVKEEEYNDFYKQISHDGADPLCVIHYSVEGVQDYKVLLFIPAHRPFEPQFNFGEQTIGPRLYVQRVQIMDNCEDLLPPYLRFVKGVVDSSDLPLNISREILQHTRMLEAIQKEIVKSVFKELKWLLESDYDKYVQFFRELGSILKEGIGQDYANREAIADLLLVESIQTEVGKLTTLAKYVDAMPENQNDIYYLTGESRGLLEHSPYLEVFRAKGQDVLLLTDPIDEIVVSALTEYKQKTLKAGRPRRALRRRGQSRRGQGDQAQGIGGVSQRQVERSERGAAHQPSQGKRHMPGRARRRHDVARRAPNAADGPSARRAGAHPGDQSRSRRNPGDGGAPRKKCRRRAFGGLRPPTVRRSRADRGLEGARSVHVRSAHQRPHRPRRENVALGWTTNPEFYSCTVRRNN